MVLIMNLQLTNTTTSSNYIYRQVTLSTSTTYRIVNVRKTRYINIQDLDTWEHR
jgi:hypothetical protein